MRRFLDIAQRRKGFTLIELLVVIAIIAILAAMLFPVFARARESARKIQCLSNVKNIATAVQMYLTDYDKSPPAEHRPEVLAYFDSYPGGGNTHHWESFSLYPDCQLTWQANPYLRWPVIMDEYVKNRDVYRCPSARMEKGSSFINGMPDWFRYLQVNASSWGQNSSNGFFCPAISFPNGWGGSVTDSIMQRTLSGPDTGGFEESVSYTHWPELKPSQVDDPSWFVVACDAGSQVDSLGIGTMVLPDVCALECAGPGCCPISWANCSDAKANGMADPLMKRDHTLWKSFTRHLGGSNLGFMDGHASWMPAEALLTALDPHKNPPSGIAQYEMPVFEGKMRGPNEAWGPYTTPVTHQDWSSGCGVPPLN